MFDAKLGQLIAGDVQQMLDALADRLSTPQRSDRAQLLGARSVIELVAE